MNNYGRRVLSVTVLVGLAMAAHARADANAPVPDPPATAPTTLPASTPSGYPFQINQRASLTIVVGPIQLKAAQFKQQKPDEIEALLDFYCEEGKDQSVTYEVTFLDARGTAVLTIKDRKGIEETDNTTFKKKLRVPPGLLESVKTFTVTFSSVPD